MKKCPFCGKENNENDAKCIYCGKHLPVQSIFMVNNKNNQHIAPTPPTVNKNIFTTANASINRAKPTSNTNNKNPFSTPTSTTTHNNSVNNTGTVYVKKISRQKLRMQNFIKMLSKLRTVRPKILYITGIIIVVVFGGYFLYRYLTTGGLYSNTNTYKSIVKILYTDSIDSGEVKGSGIIFSKDGLVLTNNHIIENQDFGTALGEIKICILNDISTIPDCKYTGELIIRNSDQDLAIIKINNYLEQTHINLFDNLGTPLDKYLEKKVKVVGYPGLGGENLTVTEGIIAGIDESGDLKTDAEINHGNSGGGSFDQNNKFLGIPAFMVSEEGGKISYIISIVNIKKRFDEILYTTNRNNTYLLKDFTDNNLRFSNKNEAESSADSEKVINKFARIEENKDQYEEIFNKIDEILKIRPQSPLAYEYLADDYYDLGEYDTALEMYDLSLELNPYSFTTYIQKGNSLFELKRYNEAISLYKDLINIFTDDNANLSIIDYNLGLCYDIIGNKNVAQNYYLKAKEEDPNIKMH